MKKGVAGLNVILSVASMLFVIGAIVMVFVLAGSQLSKDSSDIADDLDSAIKSYTAEDVVSYQVQDNSNWTSLFVIMASLIVLVLLVVVVVNSLRTAGLR